MYLLIQQRRLLYPVLVRVLDDGFEGHDDVRHSFYPEGIALANKAVPAYAEPVTPPCQGDHEKSDAVTSGDEQSRPIVALDLRGLAGVLEQRLITDMG